MISISNDESINLKGLTFIDLFAGIGGFRLALNSFGAKCVFTSEWDKSAQEVYESNFGDKPHGDITSIDEKDIPEHDILCGGFPCQAFSISGKQRGFEDTRGTLFFDIIRIARHHKPKILFLENVSNFEKHDNGNTLKTILSAIEEINYDVYYQVLNASDFGIPHKRERIFFVCFRKDLEIKNFQFTKNVNNPVKLLDITLPDEAVKEYIINREDIEYHNVKVDIDIFGNYPQKPIRVGTVNKGGQGERIYHECGHAITLSAYGGGVGAKTGLYLINGKVRKLAPRECARLLGLPDSFKIAQNKNQAYKQFGNGVVVDVLQFILIDVNKRLSWIGQSWVQRPQKVVLEMKKIL